MKIQIDPFESYVSVKSKFYISIVGATIWTIISVYLSIPWLGQLAIETNYFLAFLIVGSIAYIPGWINMLLLISIVLDNQPNIDGVFPSEDITLLITAYNEESGIYDTLKYLSAQSYKGNLRAIIVDNNSTDSTSLEIKRAQKELQRDTLKIDYLFEAKKGKFNALNSGLTQVATEYVITLDADTILHKEAINNLVARIKCSQRHIKAVAGAVLVRNSRDNLLAQVQEWDYFLSIASVKKMQGLYQGTLVAQGAFSLYDTKSLKEVGGWSDAIGEDIVLSWELLKKGYSIYFEPTAVAFTEVPTKFSHFVKQRSRWARGMIEGLRNTKPWEQPNMYYALLTGIDLVIPIIDFGYTFFWIPGLILACFGKFYIVGPASIMVWPITMLTFYILYFYQKRNVFDKLRLFVRKNKRGLLAFILGYQLIMSPISFLGYIQELFKFKRTWK